VGLTNSVLGSPRPPTRTSSCRRYLSRFTTFRPALAVALPGFDFLMWLFAPLICRRNGRGWVDPKSVRRRWPCSVDVADGHVLVDYDLVQHVGLLSK